MIKPYYEHGGITIFHGDAKEIMPRLMKSHAIVTDPPYGIDFHSARPSEERKKDKITNDGFEEYLLRGSGYTAIKSTLASLSQRPKAL